MTKKNFEWKCSGLLLLMLWAASAAAQGKPQFFSIGTGGPTGVYFVVGQTICRTVHKLATEGITHSDMPSLRCAAPSTAGSIYNIEMVRSGELDFGIVQSDWHYHGYKGTDRFNNKPFKNLRAIFSVHSEPFQLVVAKGSGVQSWKDLKGKRVNIGNRGSGHYATMKTLMKSYSSRESDFAAVTELPPSKQSRALCEGQIDAFVYTVGVPNRGIGLATNGCSARLVSLDSPIIIDMVAKNKFYAFVKIPKGTYKTTTSDVTTFGVKATLVTRSEQPEIVVREIVRAVFENLDDFRNQHPAFAGLKIEEMVKDGLSAPLHEGALKYYKEKGWR